MFDHFRDSLASLLSAGGMAQTSNNNLQTRAEKPIPTYAIPLMVIGGLILLCMIPALGHFCYRKRLAHLKAKYPERYPTDPELGQATPMQSLEVDGTTTADNGRPTSSTASPNGKPYKAATNSNGSIAPLGKNQKKFSFEQQQKPGSLPEVQRGKRASAAPTLAGGKGKGKAQRFSAGISTAGMDDVDLGDKKLTERDPHQKPVVGGKKEFHTDVVRRNYEEAVKKRAEKAAEEAKAKAAKKAE